MGPLPWEDGARATAVSGDGTFIVGTSSSGGFVWTSASGAQFLAAGQPSVFPEAVSPDGGTVVGYMNVGPTNFYFPFRWTQAGGLVTLPFGVATNGVVWDTSSGGAVTVGSLDGLACRWVGSALPEVIHPPFGSGSRAFTVSDDGRYVLGLYYNGSTAGVFQFSEEAGFVDLGALTGIPYGSLPLISGNGRFAVLRTSSPNAGVDVIELSPLGQAYCEAATVNSTGCASKLVASGSRSVSDNQFQLQASGLPSNQFGIYLASRTPGLVPLSLPSQGTLCLGGGIGRINMSSQIQMTGLNGVMSLNVDLTQLPTQSVSVAVQPGETWYFQGWHRDTFGGMPGSSNLTQALAIQFD